VSSYLGKNLLKLPWNNFRGTIKITLNNACFSRLFCYNVTMQTKERIKVGMFVIVAGICVHVDEVEENGQCWGIDDDGDDIGFHVDTITAIVPE